MIACRYYCVMSASLLSCIKSAQNCKTSVVFYYHDKSRMRLQKFKLISTKMDKKRKNYNDRPQH